MLSGSQQTCDLVVRGQFQQIKVQSVYFGQAVVNVFVGTAAEGATSLTVVVKVIRGAAKACQMPSHQRLYPLFSSHPALPSFHLRSFPPTLNTNPFLVPSSLSVTLP